jgi:energy-coupling factor transport system ATP-binding protein
MISFDAVGVSYADTSDHRDASGRGAPDGSAGTAGTAGATDTTVFTGATFRVPEGELVLVVGPTGSGKSTLLRCINGLVPHFSGGTLHGTVTVAGRDTRTHRPRDLADLVGFVVQDPLSSFVTDTVEEEIAYGMEALGVDATSMRRRVEETLDLLGLADVRSRPLRDLSGGQQQRVAIGAVLAAGPRILVLDEPTSALDPVAAEDVLATLHRLVHDLGITVVVAEHRLERVIHHADHVVLIGDGRVSGLLDPADAMVTSPIYPPIIGLGRALRWSPLPLSIRDARRRASEVRESLALLPAPSPTPTHPAPLDEGLRDGLDGAVARVDGLSVRRGSVVALRSVSVEVNPGEVVAVMGRNGAGKSTLLSALVGQLRPSAGTVRLGPLDPSGAPPAEVVRRAGMVPQDPSLILYAESVAEECTAADRDFGLPRGTTAGVLRRIVPDVDAEQHPRDLSEGQRVSLALAVILASEPDVVLLDEPTRGLDYAAKRRLVALLQQLAATGHAVVLATHDVELAAEVATRVVVLAEGEVVADGSAASVLSGSPAFAPQVSKILHPLHFLTVDQVVAATGAAS